MFRDRTDVIKLYQLFSIRVQAREKTVTIMIRTTILTIQFIVIVIRL